MSDDWWAEKWASDRYLSERDAAERWLAEREAAERWWAERELAEREAAQRFFEEIEREDAGAGETQLHRSTLDPFEYSSDDAVIRSIVLRWARRDLAVDQI
jgi:hypothetical protein